MDEKQQEIKPLTAEELANIKQYPSGFAGALTLRLLATVDALTAEARTTVARLESAIDRAERRGVAAEAERDQWVERYRWVAGLSADSPFNPEGFKTLLRKAEKERDEALALAESRGRALDLCEEYVPQYDGCVAWEALKALGVTPPAALRQQQEREKGANNA